MNKRFLIACILVSTSIFAQQKKDTDRAFWLRHLDQLARPVMRSLANDSLKMQLPKALSKRTDSPQTRLEVAYLEAFARTLCGIAPWLNLEGGSATEIALRNQYRTWSLKAISNAVNPQAKDYMTFEKGGQPLVDASFLALSFVRCPWLWEHLDEKTKEQVVNALLRTRKIKPVFSNWILFSGMIEAFFCQYGYQWDVVRVEYCLRQFDQWYVGDGVYSDGDAYHWDYYNSFVIHPYLNQILAIVGHKTKDFNWAIDKMAKRSERYALIQERLINNDGSYPITGRSIVYRGAAFQHLADVAWQHKLPVELSPAQVRCALTAVLKKTTESPSTFKDGWLTFGVYGSQGDLADVYNNTGSLYLCSVILLPLGLPESDPFWSNPAEKWTAQKVWTGEDSVHNDHALD